MQDIPFIDIRESNPTQIASGHRERGQQLINASTGAFGVVSRVLGKLLLPIGDLHARHWLKRNQNPYREEIAEVERILGVSGVSALNLCYEWGCTSGGYNRENGVTLARVLDWPFPALGETMVVAHQRGNAGDFYNVTWPGMAGVFTAMAPQRFAAALNQAPMRRYRLDIVSNWIGNRIRTHRSRALPPAHLLRKAFEEAGSYAEAKEMLANTPLSIPVIYILTGTKPDEACVIERLENEAVIREMHYNTAVCAANHFQSHFNGMGHGWLPRALASHERAVHGDALAHTPLDDRFDWFRAPIANRLSRLALTADAGKGTLHLIGTDGEKQVTRVFSINGTEISSD